MNAPDRTTAPTFHSVEKIELAPAKQLQLSNGVPVYFVDAGTQDVIRLEFIFRAGTRYQPQTLVASSANDMLDEGTQTRSAEAIAEELDFYGAFIETETTQDTATFTLFTLNKHLPSTLQVVQDIIRNAAFPEKEFGVYMSNKLQQFLVDSDKVSVLARRRFNELLFGATHPYGIKAEREDFDKINRELLMEFHGNFYTADRCTIVAAGKIPAELITLLEEQFGDAQWKSDRQMPEIMPAPQSEKQRVQTIVKDGALQSAIRMGRVMFNKRHPDYLGMQVLNAVLGGYFGSRLMANIREDKGYTYGIGSGLVSMYDSGYFVISTEVGVDVTNAALKEVHFEIEKLQNDLVPKEELELVRNYLIGTFLRSTDGPFSLGDRLKGLLGYDLGYDYYDRYVETIKTITDQQLRDLAQRYLKKEDLIELVAGDRK